MFASFGPFELIQSLPSALYTDMLLLVRYCFWLIHLTRRKRHFCNFHLRLLTIFPTSQKVKVKSLSRVWLFATPWTVAYQSPQSMEFSRQEYWSGLPFPSPGDLPDAGIEPRSPALQADAWPSEPPGNPLLHRSRMQLWRLLLRMVIPIIHSGSW